MHCYDMGYISGNRIRHHIEYPIGVRNQRQSFACYEKSGVLILPEFYACFYAEQYYITDVLLCNDSVDGNDFFYLYFSKYL